MAVLIEPYLDAGGGWEDRMRWLMSWADFEKSRCFFEIFLALVDRGSFDEVSPDESSGRGFWSVIHGLGASQPAWLAELVSRWLQRRLLTAEPDPEHRRGERMFLGSHAAGKEFSDAAQADPLAFVRFVLPVALEAAELYSDPDDEPPRRDTIWWNFFQVETVSAEGALRSALVNSLKAMASMDPDSTDLIRNNLQVRGTYFANMLLLELYEGCGAPYADEAADLLVEQPWRFQCGYSDSSYWIAKCAIKAFSPHCSDDRFTALEGAILEYASPYEKSKEGFRAMGSATHVLLSALPLERLSAAGRRIRGELVRKFGERDERPQGVRSGIIGAPIEQKALKRMTDAQWLAAIARYQGEKRDWETFTGGAWELANKLEERVKKDPERFGRLLFQFPEGTNSCYFDNVVSGLAETQCDEGLKLDVARRVFALLPEDCGKNLARLLSGVDTFLPEEFLEMLAWLATEHPDPETELWKTEASGGQPFYGGSIHMNGYNTVRGAAMESIARLIWKDRRYAEAFRSVLAAVVNEESKAVRSCTADALRGLAYHFPDAALEIFRDLIGLDPELLVTAPCQDMVYRGIPEHFEQVRPYIECLLGADLSEAMKAGGGFAFLAILWAHPAEGLVEVAMGGNVHSRVGVCEVASRNLGQSPCRERCDHQLRILFEDEAEEVRLQAAGCFREIEDRPLEDYEDLISLFCDSPAYDQDSHSLLHLLERSHDRVADLALMACRKFLDRFTEEARDISTHRASETRSVSALLFRAYQQGDEAVSTEALDLIDELVLSGAYDVQRGFEEFER